MNSGKLSILALFLVIAFLLRFIQSHSFAVFAYQSTKYFYLHKRPPSFHKESFQVCFSNEHSIISEKDFLLHMGSKDTRSFMDVVAQCLSNKGCVAITMRQQKAEDIMTSPAITIREDTPVSEIVNIFTKKNINRVPVTDDQGNLLGIVARADILQSSFQLNQRE